VAWPEVGELGETSEIAGASKEKIEEVPVPAWPVTVTDMALYMPSFELTFPVWHETEVRLFHEEVLHTARIRIVGLLST
jgi:hypothetical protein